MEKKSNNLKFKLTYFNDCNWQIYSSKGVIDDKLESLKIINTTIITRNSNIIFREFKFCKAIGQNSRLKIFELPY